MMVTPPDTTPTKTTQPAPGDGSSGRTIIGRRLSRSLRGPAAHIPIPISSSSSRHHHDLGLPMPHGSGGGGGGDGGPDSPCLAHHDFKSLIVDCPDLPPNLRAGRVHHNTRRNNSLLRRLTCKDHSQTVSPSVSTQLLHPASAAAPASSSQQQQQQTASQISATIDRDGYQSQTFMRTLQAIIVIATDAIDLPIARLTSEPHVCPKCVHRVQAIHRAWDEHPDWHGRAWYVQLLLAVAPLSRVVEWFEAKRQFWNFDEASSTSVAGREGG
jgi:hypothetical protein